MVRSATDLVAGVIGARGIGEVHLRVLAQAGAGRLMIAGRSNVASLAAELSHNIGSDVVAADSVESLAEACDFVSVCTPNALHLEQAALCLDRGCHVLVEKPLFWKEGLSRAQLATACKAVFDGADGRLGVNYPTACFTEPFLASCGSPAKLKTFALRYQTRGVYRDDAIAVDLLPHGFSLFLALGGGGEVSALDVTSTTHSWTAAMMVGPTQCQFDFVQDPDAAASVLSFEVDGQHASRVQTRRGNGFDVSLDVPGVADTPRSMVNPMTSSIRGAFEACRKQVSFDDEPATSLTIMGLIAACLLD